MSLRAIAGHQVNVVELGEGPQPMLVMHCFLTRHEALLRLVQPFAKTHRITLFDLPAHGASEDPAPGTDLHDLTLAIARDLIDAPAHVMGHSFGGTVALRLAVEHPQSVAALSLIEPVYFALAHDTAGGVQHDVDYRPVRAAIDARDDRATARAFLDLWGGGAPWDDLSPRAQAEMLRAIPSLARSERQIYHDAAGVLAPGRLESLTSPIDLVEGADSHPVMATVMDRLEARCAQVTRHVIPEAGHMVPISHPRLVAKALLGG